MTVEEIRALSRTSSVRGGDELLVQTQMLGEVAAQLAELNQHLAVIASLVQPAEKKWPAHIIIGRADWVDPDVPLR